MLIRDIELLQQWYFELTFPDTCVWFTLNESNFTPGNSTASAGNKDATTPTPTTIGFTPPTTMAPTPIPISEASTFLRGIKRSPYDYNKFKDDTRWKQWHSHLKATANSHGIYHIFDQVYIRLTDRHSCIVSLNSACIPTKVAMLCTPLNQQQMHIVSMPVYCRHMKRTSTHLQQQILDLSSHYYASMINGRKAMKHSSYHGNLKS
jgi:hypothetical protein